MTENPTPAPRGNERNELATFDTDQDGKADVWVVDTDGDGKADMIQLDHDSDGKVDITMIDSDQDGNPDVQIQGDAGLPPRAEP